MQTSKALVKRLDEADCLRGKGYVAPAEHATVDSAEEITVAWDRTCFDSPALDIYIYAPTQNASLLPVHLYRNYPTAPESTKVKLMPRWWNGGKPEQDATVDFYLNIVPSGNEPWDTKNPIGPTFTAKYTAPPPGHNPPDDALPSSEGVLQDLKTTFYAHGLTPAGKAALIIVPLVLASVALGLYVRKLHINRNNKTAVWAEKMDQRMSRVSVDWMAGGDGSAGPVPGSRPASYMHRPSGDMVGRPSGDLNMAGFAGRGTGMQGDASGARGTTSFDTMRDRRQSRISFAHDTQGDRVSRISFGPNSSVDHSRGHKTSASLSRIGQSGLRHSFYDGTAPAVPQVNPAYRESSYSDAYASGAIEDLDELAMSPNQHQGPMPLSSDQLDQMRTSLDANRALYLPSNNGRSASPADAADEEFRGSVLEYPAVSMISSGQQNDMFAAGDLHPSMNNQTGMAPPVNFSSPDEALKQYAAVRAGAISPADSQAASNPNNMMRTLYTPEPGYGHKPQQGSVAGTSLSEDAVVGYNEAGYSEDAPHQHRY